MFDCSAAVIERRHEARGHGFHGTGVHWDRGLAHALWTWGKDWFWARGLADCSPSCPDRIDSPSLKTWATLQKEYIMLRRTSIASVLAFGGAIVFIAGCIGSQRGTPATHSPRQQKSRNKADQPEPTLGLAKADARRVRNVPQVPDEENELLARVAAEGLESFFVIEEIRAIGSGRTSGRICIAGKGELPVCSDTGERLGEGVVLEWITPVQRGAEVNASKGKAGMLVKGGSLDHSPTYSVGALWERVPYLIDDGVIDPLRGVAFVPGVRLGALYEGDGNLMFDFVRAGDDIVHYPAGTAGSVHRFVGEIRVGRYTFSGGHDPDNPLTFALTERGYVYLRGIGTVTLPSGEKVRLPKTRNAPGADPQSGLGVRKQGRSITRVDLRKDEFVEVPELLDVTSKGKVLFKEGPEKGIVVANITGKILLYKKSDRWVHCLASVEKIDIEPGLEVPLLFFTAEIDVSEETARWLDQQQSMAGPGAHQTQVLQVKNAEQRLDLREVKELDKCLLAGSKGSRLKKRGRDLLLLEGEAYVVRRH